MKRSFIVGLGIILILLAAVAANAISGMKKPPERTLAVAPLKEAKVVTVENRQSGSEIAIDGRLIPRQKIEVFSEVGGLLKPTNPPFKEGNYFPKGRALIRIDDQEHRMNILAQKSSLMNQITLLLPDLKSDFPEAFSNWQSYLNEFKPEEQMSPLPEPESDREKYFISARNIYNLYYSIKSMEARAIKYTVRAPFSGVVASSSIDAGTLVRVGQKMGEFFNPNSYELEAAVNLSDLEFIKKGNQVSLSSDDISGSWKGRVIRISDRIDVNTQTVKVFIAVEGKQLKEGMYLNATVAGKPIEEVVELNRELLSQQQEIFIVKDSLLNTHPVEPKRFSATKVWVQGIPDGTTILAEPIQGAYAGMKVSPKR